MYKTSIIIPTYNRLGELKKCIDSILTQTVKANELIIVDDGNLQEMPCRKECEESGIRYVYHKKETPGLTESRSKGVELATGDIVFFFDDDVVLYPDYIEEILGTYKEFAEGYVGGVGGAIVDHDPLTALHYLKRIYSIVFLISGFQEGKALPSGFFTEYGETGKPLEGVRSVDFISGGVSSYRKEIFEEFAFTKKFRYYAFGEDKDFSLQVSAKYKLLLNPEAKVLHAESIHMRPDMEAWGRKDVTAKYLLYKHRIRKGWWNPLLFCYAFSGYIIFRLIVFIFKPGRKELDRLKGVFSAVKEIIRGNVSIE